MDKIKICEAMYALPGEVVVRRRKSLVLPAALLAAGVAILVLNHVYGASMTNNLRSSAVFIGGSLALAGMITLAARFFSAEGAPYYRAGRSYLRYDELYFERSQSRDVVALVAEGNVERLLAMPHARVPAVSVAMCLRVRGPGIPAADPVADQPAERGGLRGVGFVAALRDRNCAR